MEYFLALPVLGLALMIQVGIISRINLLSGSADLMMAILVSFSLQPKVKSSWLWAIAAGLMVGVVSGLPWYLVMIGYLMIIGLSYLLQQRIWQSRLLEVFIVLLVGTMITHLLSIGYLVVIGSDVNLLNMLSLITLPSILLNLVLSVPVYLLIRDLVGWIYPSESVE
jgi:hypothetical protein